jgi:hypothetical protein
MIRTTTRALVLSLLAALALAVPVHAAEDPASVTSYDATFTVRANGTLHVVETLKAEFPVERHGIFRTFGAGSAGQSKDVPLDLTVARDGAPEPFAVSKDEAGGLVYKIGRPNVTLTGVHAYRLEYDLSDVMEVGGSTSRFYWNLIPTGWDLPIASSKLTVDLPARSTRLQCVVGLGAGRPCQVSGTGTTALVVKTGALAPHTPVTLATVIDTSYWAQLVVGVATGAVAQGARQA